MITIRTLKKSKKSKVKNDKALRKPFKKWIKTPSGKNCLIGLLFTLPMFAALGVFRFYTIFQCIVQSFFQYKITDLPGRFVGIDNYTAILSSDLFFTYFLNTITLYGYLILFSFFIPIIQALMLFQLTRTRGLARYLYIFPTGITALASMSIWKYIWDPDKGLANFITSHLGLGTFRWLQDENLVKFCLRFPGILGGGMIIAVYLVTMNNIPKVQFEAAEIDGANKWQIMRYITWPGLRGMVYLQFLMTVTASLLAFDDVYVMTQGGPGFASSTLVYGAYVKAFREQNFGQAMAMSVIIGIFSFILTVVVNHIKKRSENES